jgi:hypothetical protein
MASFSCLSSPVVVTVSPCAHCILVCVRRMNQMLSMRYVVLARAAVCETMPIWRPCSNQMWVQRSRVCREARRFECSRSPDIPQTTLMPSGGPEPLHSHTLCLHTCTSSAAAADAHPFCVSSPSSHGSSRARAAHHTTDSGGECVCVWHRLLRASRHSASASSATLAAADPRQTPRAPLCRAAAHAHACAEAGGEL